MPAMETVTPGNQQSQGVSRDHRVGLDDVLGAALEETTRRRHRRRLQRSGHARVLEAALGWWARTGAPPRAGNDLEFLVDGAAVFGRIAAAVRSATSHVHLSFWALDPQFALLRDDDVATCARCSRRPPNGGGWHDATARVEGPAVADLAAHFATRWAAASGEVLPEARAARPSGATRVQVVRTLPEGAYAAAPNGDFSALEAHLAAIKSAEKLIYLENQLLSSVEIVDALVDKLRDPRHPDLRIVAVLPVRLREGRDETRGQLRVLRKADRGGGRFSACSLREDPPAPGRPVYVHAKIAIVDDAWVSVGSVNLSDHSLFSATELQLVSDDAAAARRLRYVLWAEHLGLPLEDIAAQDARALVDRYWRGLADVQLARERAGAPLTARVVRLPGRSRRFGRAAGALQNMVRGA